MKGLSGYMAGILLHMSRSMCWSEEYRLIIIEEEEVPLASGVMSAENPFFLPTLVVMVAVLLGTFVGMYYLQCKSYRQRIVALGGAENHEKMGWNLRRLKEEVAETEWNMVKK
ncbi:hypothetical protein [Roseburia sp. 499]|uniref:hypothetical protein n=1 Tax=Roseburia sp. 499 TaxID=1261634 RepID=UPI0009525236|nr:hypothetical protein [Roseburia sp. 499]WVK70089.1 hypothetical protein BIV20_00745 [Roseburia sp. 499]